MTESVSYNKYAREAHANNIDLDIDDQEEPQYQDETWILRKCRLIIIIIEYYNNIIYECNMLISIKLVFFIR